MKSISTNESLHPWVPSSNLGKIVKDDFFKVKVTRLRKVKVKVTRLRKR